MNWSAIPSILRQSVPLALAVVSGCSYVMQKEVESTGGEFHWVERRAPSGRVVATSAVLYVPPPPPAGTNRHSTLQLCAHESLRHWTRSALASMMTNPMEDPGAPQYSEFLAECARRLPATTRNWTRVPNPEDPTGVSWCWTLPARDPDVEHDAGPWLLCEPRRHQVDNPLMQAALDCAWWRNWRWFVELSVALAARDRGEPVELPAAPEVASVVGACVDQLEKIAEAGAEYPGVHVDELVELLRRNASGKNNQSVEVDVNPVFSNSNEKIGVLNCGSATAAEITRVFSPGDQLSVDCEIEFATDSFELEERSMPCLDEVARVILDHPEFSAIELEGHTDPRGTSSHNQRLSEARASAVAAYLIAAGVEPSRLTTVGRGSTQPLCEPRARPRCMDENRRVELHVHRR